MAERPARVIVAAVAENGVIGRAGGLPFRLPGDLKRFRRLTVGKPVVMGRLTYLSIGRPLPERTTVVVGSDPTLAQDGVLVAPDLPAALTLADEVAGESGADEVMIAGGAQVYAAALLLADRLEITRVHARPDGDTLFPPFDEAAFEEVARERPEPDPRDEYPFTFLTYRRRPVDLRADPR